MRCDGRAMHSREGSDCARSGILLVSDFESRTPDPEHSPHPASHDPPGRAVARGWWWECRVGRAAAIELIERGRTWARSAAEAAKTLILARWDVVARGLRMG